MHIYEFWTKSTGHYENKSQCAKRSEFLQRRSLRLITGNFSYSFVGLCFCMQCCAGQWLMTCWWGWAALTRDAMSSE